MPWTISKIKIIITNPRIIAKDSSLEKYEAPGSAVTVSLPEKEIEHKTREISRVIWKFILPA